MSGAFNMKNAAIQKTNDDTFLVESESTPKHPPCKRECFLEFAISNYQKGITQPEAHACYRESCLRSTISSMQRTYGILFSREFDSNTVGYYRQRPFKRYWFKSEQHYKKAVSLLDDLKKARGANSQLDNAA